MKEDLKESLETYLEDLIKDLDVRGYTPSYVIKTLEELGWKQEDIETLGWSCEFYILFSKGEEQITYAGEWYTGEAYITQGNIHFC